MKQYITLALGLLAGTAIGAIGVGNLQAQNKPKGYLITETNITDLEGYQKEFVPPAVKVIKELGGSFLILGSSTVVPNNKPITGLMGDPLKRINIQVYDSIEALDKAYKSKEYQDIVKLGEKYGSFRKYAVEGL